MTMQTAEKRLMFYVNPAWRREGIHTPLLNPWWGNPLTESSLFTKQLFDSYSFDTAYYGITDDIRAANLVLAPYTQTWLLRHNQTLFDECVQAARSMRIPLLLDGMGDVDHPIRGEDVFILRYGGYRFLPEKGRISVPLFADDLLTRYCNGELQIRKKTEGKPVVGFAGWASLAWKQKIRTYVKEIPVRIRGVFDSHYRACTKGVFWRMKAVRILRESPLVEFHSRARASFSGSAKTAEADQKQLQREMVDTILESDYALDVRGDGNNSARLFEILSLGRIPVIVDTERIFPFSSKIDYSSFALIVDFRDIAHLPERIAEFHRNVSSERFEEMQRNARDAFVHHSRIDAMTQHIVEELRAQMVERKVIR